jgi:integrase
VSAQRGQIFRAPAGSWAIRYYDAHGRRRQKHGFRTKSEAKLALDETLRRVRLGPAYRPEVELRRLVETYLARHEAAPSTLVWLRENLKPAVDTFGDELIGSLTADRVAAWRVSLPEGKRYRSHRALRQVLQAAVRWKWLDENVATLVVNPEPHSGEIHPFESWDEIDAVVAELGDTDGALVIFMAGTGVRPEEAFAGSWSDVDLERRAFRARRAFAKGRLKEYAKTTGSRRAVPLRARVAAALEHMENRRGLLFPAPAGGHIDINNWRSRQWTPALEASGVTHRRIYDLRHTYATWSLAAGIDIFTLARRMGTSVKMIDRTYGHLAAGADEYERELLDRFDCKLNGRYLGGEETADAA